MTIQPRLGLEHMGTMFVNESPLITHEPHDLIHRTRKAF